MVSVEEEVMSARKAVESSAQEHLRGSKKSTQLHGN